MAQTLLSHPASSLPTPKAGAAARRGSHWRPGRVTGYGLAIGFSLMSWTVAGLLIAGVL